MAIKKISFSFDIPLTTLLSLIATGGADMRVDVFGDDKPGSLAKLAKGKAPLLLEGPPSTRRGKSTARGKDGDGNKVTGFDAILKFFAANPKRVIQSSELKPLMIELGLAENSVSPQIAMMKQKGYIESASKGMYTMLREGVEEAKRRGFPIGEAKAADKKPKAEKTAAVQNGMNGAHAHG